MKPPPFEYLAPNSLEEALELLAQHGDDIKILAGGQSLIPALNFRLAQPAILLDINSVPGLDYVRAKNGNGGIQMGAMVRQRTLERDDLIAARAPLLHETMPFIAHPQIRNRGTLGGSLAHADPAAEMPVIAVAREALITIQSSIGKRTVSARDFFEGMFMVDCNPTEMLVGVEWPALPERSGTAFVELARRHGDYAMMGVAAVVSLNEDGNCAAARLVYLNAGDMPVVAEKAVQTLIGEVPTEKLFRAAAEIASKEEMDPFGNVHASPEYQRHLAGVLTVRALKRAFERAK